jgi:hypothetical protein
LNINFEDSDLDLKLHESKDHKYARPEMYQRVWWHYSWWYKDTQVVYVAKRSNKEIEFFGYTFDDKRAHMPTDLKEDYDRENVDYNG